MTSQGGGQFGDGGWQPSSGGPSGVPASGAGPDYPYASSPYPPPGYPPASGGGYPPPDPGWQQPPPPTAPMPGWPDVPQSSPPYQQPDYQAPYLPGQQGPGVLPGYPMGQPGMPGGPGMPGRRSNNTGLILGIVAGGLALLLVCGGVFYFGYDALKSDPSDPVVLPSITHLDGPASSAGPTVSPRASTRNLSTLDSATTDTTPFTVSQFFHSSTVTGSSGETYTREGSKIYDNCEEGGSGKVDTMLKANGCLKMVVGVYLTQAQDIMIGVMAFALPASSNATAVVSAVGADEALRDELMVWCPSAPKPGASVCDSQIPQSTYMYFNYVAFHRYALVSVQLYTDARSKGVSADLSKAGDACLREVADSIPRVY